jgi:hypothetical protein
MFMDFVHRPMFFQKQELALSKGPNRVGATFLLPEDRNRSSFRNVFLKKSLDDGQSP